MAQAAAKTAAGPVALVAMEQCFPSHQRIVTDDLAHWMLPLAARAFVQLVRPSFARDWIIRTIEGSFPGPWSGMMCRKRYIVDALVASAGAIDAVVNLGAGLDTRLYRLPAIAGIPAWECDQARNIRLKQDRLCRRFGSLPDHITLVPVDFDSESPGPVLAAQGYTGRQPTFFIWEAVSQYLSKTGIDATLAFSADAPQGSRLALTYVQKDFLDGRSLCGLQRLYDRYVASKIWLFGLDPGSLSDLLDPYGWRLTDDIGGEELMDRYVAPTGRSLASTPIERVALAERA